MSRPEKPLAEPETPVQLLGATVRNCRRAARLTLTETAARVGWSPSTIHLLEHGKQAPSESLVQALDRVLSADGSILAAYEDVLHDKRQRKIKKPSLESTRTAGSVAVHGDASGWVCDVTVPDGAIFRPKESFTKTWRIRNDGVVPWKDRYLLRIGSPGGHGLIGSPVLTPIPDTQPGQTVDVSVPCTAQTHEGSSAATFKMADKDGNLYFPGQYGVGLMVAITVVGDNMAGPAGGGSQTRRQARAD